MASVKFTQALKERIKREFIEGYLDDEDKREYPTLDALVKRHNVARNTLYRNAKKEDWQSQKNRFQTKLEQKVETGRMEQLADEAKRLDRNCLQIAQAMLGRVAKRMTEDAQREQQDPNHRGMTAAELRELSHVTQNAQKIGKLALGEAQEISKVAADVSAPESYINVIRELEQLARQKASYGKHTIQ